MKTISMYEASIPVFVRALTALAGVLEKAEAHAKARNIDPAVLVAARLYPDMLPLSSQVQIASDAAKGGAARLAQQQAPSFTDDEKTFAELVERCNKTITYLKTIPAAAFEGAEGRTVTWKTRTTERSMEGMPYLLHQVIPNVYFHATTAYAILRHNGVEVGKQDFLGKPQP
jgi:uncharacterized protein